MIDLDQARTQLLDLHRRELSGLDTLAAALARVQASGLCVSPTGADAAIAFPLPICIPAPPPRPKGKLPGYVPRLPRAPQEPAAKTRRKYTAQPSPLRTAILEYAAATPEIDVKALPPSLRKDLKKTKKALANMEAAGLLTRVRSGVYRIKGKKPAAAAAPVRATPGAVNTVPAPAINQFQPGSYRVRGRVSPMQVAIQDVAMKLGARSKWTATEMLGWLTPLHRDLVDTEGKRSDMHVRLMDMANAGLLIREGVSPHSTYRLGPKLANRDRPEPEEDDAPTIHVPRDPDAGRD